MVDEKSSEQSADKKNYVENNFSILITTLDNPEITSNQVQLKGENYKKWARSLQTVPR